MKALMVIFSSCIVIIRGADWTYADESAWPGKCSTGRQQSPINIVTRDALPDPYGAHLRGPLAFRGYGGGGVRLRGQNNGHTLKWRLAEDTVPPVVSGGPLRGNYSFAQFHLHWMSEHAIDGYKYPLEIHMVHIKSGLSVDEALATPDGIAVIGILCNTVVEKASTRAFDELMQDVSQLIDRNSESTDTVTLDLTRLFSPDMQSYYTYHGSLTTPGCDEVVTWIVMDKPILISDVQYKLISRVDIGGINNYRSLQRAERVVYRSARSCGAALAPGPAVLTSLLVAVATCVTRNITGLFGRGFCVLFSLKKWFLGGTSHLCAVN